MKIRIVSLVVMASILTTICESQVVVDDKRGIDLYHGNRIEIAKAIKNTTLLVVIDSTTSSVGKEYADAFKQYWKFNPYKFITPAEISNYANSTQYSFFSFAERSLIMGSQTSRMGGGGADYSTTVVTSRDIYTQMDSLPKKAPVENCFIYGVFIGGNGYDNKQPLKKLDVADYEIVSQDEGYLAYNGLKLRDIQLKSNQCIPEVLQEIQSDLNIMINYGITVSIDDKREKINVLYESKKVKCTTEVYYYGDAKNWLKTKKILIDSTLADNISVQYLSQVLEINVIQIQLVSAQAINDAITKKDENIYYVKQRCSSNGTTRMFRVYNANNEKITDFTGAVYAITEGSRYNPKGSFSAELFDKNIDPHQERAKIQIDMSK